MIPRINVNFGDEKLLKDLKKFVNDNHPGKFKQYYAYELRNAVKLLLAAHNVDDYPNIVKKDKDLKYIIIPEVLHTHPSRTINHNHVEFLIKFFKTYKNQKKVPKTELIGFIKSSLLIKDNRAVDGWLLFLKDIKWVKPWATEGWDIKLNEKSLFDILGEDPTGTYQPYNDEVLKVFSGVPIKNETSRAGLRRS